MKNVIGIGVMLQTPQGTYLLQERDDKTDRHPGGIAPFGGGVENGEDVFACAKRELLEELNLALDTDKLETVGLFQSLHVPDAYIHMFIAKDIDRNVLELREGKNILELSKDECLKHPRVTDFTKEVLRVL